ncbi:MAG: RNA 2',3'-cyclic phosphodiesterase [Burkholderiales bacterium]|nr:RNA 2',3'-cyclic phosphodiesterase [Burkholderiales bacterium]
MRLFFALWPQPALRTALAAAARRLQPGCGGRMPAARNLHLTLAFLGDVAAGRLPELAEIAGEAAAAVPPFTMGLECFGWWPRQRLVWAAPVACPPALQVLAEVLAGGLRAAGFRSERRRFLPHVTLLRDARHAPAAAAERLPQWRVSELVLAVSEPGAGGPRYRSLGVWPLTAGL